MKDEWRHQVLRSGNRFDIPPRYCPFIPTALSPRQLDVQLCGPFIRTIQQSYPDRRGTSNCESYRLYSTLYKSCYILHLIVTSSPTSLLLLTAFGEPNSTGLSIIEYSSHTCSSDGCLNLENKYAMWYVFKKKIFKKKRMGTHKYTSYLAVHNFSCSFLCYIQYNHMKREIFFN